MAEQKRKQMMRYNEQELSLINNTFADNDERLKSLRKFMLQLKLNEADKQNLKVFEKKEVMAVLRRAFLPVIEEDTPLGQVIDLYLSLDFKDKDTSTAMNLIMSRQLLIDYLEQQLTLLGGGKDGKLSLKEMTNFKDKSMSDCREVYINLLTRNTLITHTEHALMELGLLAGTKNETVEEQLKRLGQDSTK